MQKRSVLKLGTEGGGGERAFKTDVFNVSATLS